MEDDSTAPVPERAPKRARVDAAPVKPPAVEAAPTPGMPVDLDELAKPNGRRRLAAAVAATEASAAGTKRAKPEAPEDVTLPARRRRPADSAPKPVWIERNPRPRRLSYLVQAAAITVAVGLGWAVGGRGAAPAPAATPESVQALAEEVLRLQGDLRSLKGGVEAVREGVEHQRQDTAARFQHWGERLDAVQPDREIGPRLAALAGRLDRLEGPDRDPGARLVQIGERLERAEKLLAVRTAAAAAPEQTGSIAPPTKPVLDRFALREVYNGVALVESQGGGVVEVSAGQTIPGAGRVETIERRGKAWALVTNRGVITAQPW